MYANLTNFNFNEISNWLNDYVLFLIKPRQVITKILQKSKEEVFGQFLFHFIIYTASFVFLSFGTTINDWIKPAIINLFLSIPLIILFFISTKIASREKYSKKIIVYVLSCLFVFVPIYIVIYATFLASENYTFRYLLDILSSISVLYIIFNLGFAIENNKIKALKITLINYLLLNFIFFCFERINRDPYSQTNVITSLNIEDPIYDEYKRLVKSIKNKEKLPTIRMIAVYKDDIKTYFCLQDVVKENISSSNDKEERIYLQAIASNLEHIKEYSITMKFRRNQTVSELWTEYFNHIKEEAEYKVESLDEIEKLKMKQLSTGETLASLEVKLYSMSTNVSKMVTNQMSLKAYNNRIIKDHQDSTICSEISYIILLFFGKTADYIIGDVILKEGAPKPYKEVFLEAE